MPMDGVSPPILSTQLGGGGMSPKIRGLRQDYITRVLVGEESLCRYTPLETHGPFIRSRHDDGYKKGKECHLLTMNYANP